MYFPVLQQGKTVHADQLLIPRKYTAHKQLVKTVLLKTLNYHEINMITQHGCHWLSELKRQG